MTCMPSLPARNWWRLRARVAAARGALCPRASDTARRLLRRLGSAALACALLACPAWADSWQADLYDEGLPSHLVAVDKARQTFMFFEKKSPLKLKYTYPCTTGQIPGDKQALNDLRTPEGVYFVEYKIAGGLDFKEYGGIAYTLNYPNPVDKLRGKTGHGIWIHSKGFGIEPLSTRGCVAIGLKDIDEVGPSLLPGTAVVLAERLDEKAQPRPDRGGTAHELRRLMQSWSSTWAARSPKLFDYYDQEAYTKAMPETFAAFRQNKERLFKMLRFIRIYNRKIHVLEGPGYWVTWSEQLYTASNLSTEGIRRLYWQRGKDKKFRIVGMEWTPRNLGMQAAYSKGQLVAEAPLQTVSDASSEAPRLPRLDMPEAAPEVAQAQNSRPGPPIQDHTAQEAAETLLAISDPLIPRRSPAPAQPPAEVNWGSRAAVQDRNGDDTGPAPTPPAPATAVEPSPGPAATPPSTVAPAPLALTPETRASLEAAVNAWGTAFAARSTEIAGLYDEAHYNRVTGVPRGPSYAATLRNLEHRFKTPWLRLVSRRPALDIRGDVAVSRSELLAVSPRGMEQGVLTLWWRRGEDAAFRIVGSQFKPAELGLAADWLEQVSGDISAVVEQWRAAWEAGNLDRYMEFYSEDALQQGRRGAQNIRQQKERLWQRVRPTQVQVAGLRLVADRQGIRADMTQTYADSSGHSDRGVKTLLLRYDGTTWRIAREDWAPPAPAGQSALRMGATAGRNR